jgi:hypothetical protein
MYFKIKNIFKKIHAANYMTKTMLQIIKEMGKESVMILQSNSICVLVTKSPSNLM